MHWNWGEIVATLAFLISLIALAVKFWQFVDIKKQEQKQKEFDNYHDVVKKLNQSDTPGESIKLYRQVAAAYELRNFPEYKDVTVRILKGWLKLPKAELEGVYGPLYDEMKLTLKHFDEEI